MKCWYTLYSKPHAEYQVARALSRRGIETYLPEIDAVKERQGRTQKPFFPCYLFMRADLEQVGLSQIAWTPGLRRIVAFDERPSRLPDRVIEAIRSKLEGINAAGGWERPPFEPGETVRITDGPFKDLLAIFEGPCSPARRVQVLLTFLGQASRAHVAVEDLEKAPAGAEPPAPKRPRRTRGKGRRIKSVGQGRASERDAGTGGRPGQNCKRF
jgi:transcription elongation factor/antiterminator RfaH